jgi:predicted Ser/Thr protein kinase
MNLDLKRHAFILLREMLDQPLESQIDWLAQHYGNETELHAEVLKLRATRHGAPILDRPALALAATLAPADDDSLHALPVDSAIGAWRIQRTLGRGGMGAVFLIERSDADSEQHGALKLIRRGMDSSDILLRFRRERQILARLQRANIARLLDGGMSASGQPYLVMEYVKGQPLMAWAEQTQADLTQRLDLLRKLCDAVAYAHRQLIVHRAIKPANLLVDARGEPKLLDFGVAKVLEDTEQDEQTTAASRFLTRAYAAPEQVRGEAISTATDIHALGVLLFELLSGARFQGNAYATTGRPTLRLMQARLQVGANGPGRITAKSLRGDLGIIVARACDDEPARRYATVEAFADDIHRWQGNHPIDTRADSTRYRLSRFVRRHAIASFAGVLALSAIIVGGSIALWQAHRAENAAALTQASQRLLTSIFDASAHDRAAGARITARDLLDQGAARAQTELADQPRLQASMLQTLGILYRQLGQFEHAATLLTQALLLAATSG